VARGVFKCGKATVWVQKYQDLLTVRALFVFAILDGVMTKKRKPNLHFLLFIAGVILLTTLFVYFKKNEPLNTPNQYSRVENRRAELEAMPNLETATFAGGCFWCMEAAFEPADGVIEVISGFTGGAEVDPSYEEVVQGQTNHREAGLVFFDPNIITYEELLDVYWQQIDPTDPDGQFADRGYSYTTAIYYHDQSQQDLAETSKETLIESAEFGKPIVTEILPASEFYPAEDYHQDYYKNNQRRYDTYEKFSGRKDFVESRL